MVQIRVKKMFGTVGELIMIGKQKWTITTFINILLTFTLTFL